MSKYIDADKLKTKVKNLNLATKTYEEQVAFNNALAMVVEIITSLQQEQPEVDLEKEILNYNVPFNDWERLTYGTLRSIAQHFYELGLNVRKEELSEIELDKFAEKMNAWKSRYNHPDNIPIKATMAFTARMFYMYPDVAREWYDSLPKATTD